MFLKRIVASIRRSLFFKHSPTHDQSTEARMMLRRVQELLEITPAPRHLPPTARPELETENFERQTAR
jgi:hypothetical protein